MFICQSDLSIIVKIKTAIVMMKRFFTAMLGSLAGIWLSVILFMVLFFMFIIALIAGGTKATTTAHLTKNSVLYLNLTGSIEEREQQVDWVTELYGNSESVLPLNNIIYAIREAANNDQINGIYINCDASTAGLATRDEIIKAINDFKKSGKWVYAYSDSYTQGDYYIACTADTIFLNPKGMVDIKGLSATTLFFKGFLDKVGVEMQVTKVGTYKSAVEPFILTEMSEASRLQQEHYIGNMWNSVCNKIVEMRKVNSEIVNQWADSITITQSPEYYVSQRIVDDLAYRHEVEDKIASLCDKDKFEEVNLITPKDYCILENVLNPQNSENQIAVLYAVGDIVDQGSDGIVGRTMAPQILELANDDDVKALILRVNSGGGSAFASEQIWEALEQFKAKGKTFYVSMGDVAASGGYYISSGADRIYAEPTTLTGSIGIFGIVPCIKPLLNNNLGITQGCVSSNANGEFISLTEPMTPYQQRSMQDMINRGYETFVGRCAEGRNIPVDSIKAIAEGRVWDGATALEIGLVDKLGGLNDAIIDLASELGYSTYSIKEYPSDGINIWKEIMKSQASIKERVIADELGEAYQYYKVIEQIKNLDPIQCRMETVIIR